MRKSYLSSQYMNSFIDSIQNQAQEAQVRHYAKWPILGLSVGTPEVDSQPSTYSGQVTKFKDWIQTRLNWLDGHMVGNFTSNENPETEFSYRIFPNPTHDLLYLESSSEIQSIGIYSSNGTCVTTKYGISGFSMKISVSGFSPGLYLVRLKTKGNQTISSKLVIN